MAGLKVVSKRMIYSRADVLMQLPLASISTSSLFAVSKSGLTLTRLFQEGESVPGTTDSILLMGIFIVLIVVIPIVWTRRRWMR